MNPSLAAPATPAAPGGHPLAAPAELLEWDTAFFGVRIARATSHRLSAENTPPLLDWCAAHQIDCLYFLADADDPQTPRLAAASQFNLVDIRISLAVDAGAPVSPAVLLPGLRVEPATSSDVPALRQLAAVSHRDSRFYADPGFPPSLADALYETWIARACQLPGQVVFVGRLGQQIAGYLACALDAGGAGRISLIAVAAEQQGRGLGQALLSAGRSWFQQQHAPTVHVVTQGRNLGALRFYERNGFTTRQVQFWYHRWFRPLAAG